MTRPNPTRYCAISYSWARASAAIELRAAEVGHVELGGIPVGGSFEHRRFIQKRPVAPRPPSIINIRFWSKFRKFYGKNVFFFQNNKARIIYVYYIMSKQSLILPALVLDELLPVHLHEAATFLGISCRRRQ